MNAESIQRTMAVALSPRVVCGLLVALAIPLGRSATNTHCVPAHEEWIDHAVDQWSQFRKDVSIATAVEVTVESLRLVEGVAEDKLVHRYRRYSDGRFRCNDAFPLESPGATMPSGRRVVTAANGVYGFMIQSDREDAWSIAQLEPMKPLGVWKQEDSLREQVSPTFDLIFRQMYGTDERLKFNDAWTFEAFFAEHRDLMKDVRRTVDSTFGRLITIAFEGERLSSRGDRYILKGTVTLLEEHSMLPLNYEYSTSGERGVSHFSMSCQYDDFKSCGIDSPYTLTFVGSRGSRKSITVRPLTELDRDQMRAACYLSAFGLVEPSLGKTLRLDGWRIVALVVATLGIGFIVMRCAWRRDPKSLKRPNRE